MMEPSRLVELRGGPYGGGYSPAEEFQNGERRIEWQDREKKRRRGVYKLIDSESGIARYEDLPESLR